MAQAKKAQNQLNVAGQQQADGVYAHSGVPLLQTWRVSVQNKYPRTIELLQ